MNFLNKGQFLWISPLYYPDHKKKGVMIERPLEFYTNKLLLRRMGLWLVFNKHTPTDENISDLKKLSDKIEIVRLSRRTIVHFQSRDQKLIEKLIKALEFSLHLQIEKEEKIECYLLMAKLYLLTGRNEEALREFENIDKMRDEPAIQKKIDKQTNIIYQIADKLFNIKKKRLSFYRPKYSL